MKDDSALNLLNSLLCDGISHANASTKPGSIPPPAQLALLATLAIHPKETSKLNSLASHEIGSVSLSFLRNVLATVGPVNGKLRDAFVYHGDDRRSRRQVSNGSSHSGSDNKDGHIRGRMAGRNSVWQRGQEFWRVLGWAFNCSALYPHRWRWWKPWLEYMVDVLEDDYEERKRLDEESANERTRLGEESEECEYKLLRNSLLVSYLSPNSGRSTQLRPIMNALFADGSESSTKIFKEIFQNEAKVKSKATKKRKRVDFDKDDFGDYADDSSSGGSQPPTPEYDRTAAMTIDEATPWTRSSLPETIPLCLRLFALVRTIAKTFGNECTLLMCLQLTRAVDDVPEQCNIIVRDLYQSFVDKIAQLPVPAFTQFISSLPNHLDEETIVAIIRVLMPSLVPHTAPSPRNVDRAASDQDAVSTAILERCYLPFGYKTAENNTKLSLGNETLFRILWTSACLKWTPSLDAAVKKGVKERWDKSTAKKGNDEEKAMRETLRASGGRLLALVELLKLQGEADDVMEE